MSNSCAESVPNFDGVFDFCEPNFVFGEVEEIIIAPLELETGDPYPADWSDEDLWDALFDADTAHKIPVRGTIDEPDRPEVEASKYRKAYPPKRYTLSGNVDDLSDAAYEAMRQLQNKRVKVWWISGGYLFGLPEGIDADVDSWHQIEEGEDSMHQYHFSFSWRSKNAPARVKSPFEPAEPTPTGA